MKKVDIITALIATMFLAVFLWFATITVDIGNNTERLDSMEQKISRMDAAIAAGFEIDADHMAYIKEIRKRLKTVEIRTGLPMDEKGNIIND